MEGVSRIFKICGVESKRHEHHYVGEVVMNDDNSFRGLLDEIGRRNYIIGCLGPCPGTHGHYQWLGMLVFSEAAVPRFVFLPLFFENERCYGITYLYNNNAKFIEYDNVLFSLSAEDFLQKNADAILKNFEQNSGMDYSFANPLWIRSFAEKWHPRG